MSRGAGATNAREPRAAEVDVRRAFRLACSPLMALLPALVLLLAALAGIGFAPALSRRPMLRAMAVAFTAGTLLTMILVHVLPEAMASVPAAPVPFVLGFVAMLLLHQHVLHADPCCGHEHTQHAGLPSFLALALCSVNDGFVLAFDADAGLRSPLLWGLAVHEALAGFALFVLLREVGVAATRIYLLGFPFVAPAALLVAASLQGTFTWMAYVLAASGGALLYVVAGSLVPRVEHVAREKRAPVLAAFLLAVALNIGLELWHGAHHDHGARDDAHSHGAAPHVHSRGG